MVEALEEAGISAVAITGATAKGVKQELCDVFNSEPEPRVLVCTEAMKQGVNLQAARYVVQLERYWVPADEAQAAGRGRRADSKHPLTVVAPMVADTVDQRIAAALASKSKSAENVARTLVRTMVDDQAAAELAGEGTDFVPAWAQKKGAATPMSEGASETPIACIFDLKLWAAEEITSWCAINGYPILEAQRNGPRYLVVQFRPRNRQDHLRGVRYRRKVLRAGVLGLVPHRVD
jgi:hypothetical protein